MSTNLNDIELDSLVDRVYTKFLDLAQTQRLFLNPSTNEYDLEPVYDPSETSTNDQDLNSTDLLDYYLSNNENTFSIHRHSCLHCNKSFEKAKYLLRHFILVHLIEQQTHECHFCPKNSYFELDEFIKHQINSHLEQIKSNPLEIFDLFMLKQCQDTILTYYTQGVFYLNEASQKLINKIRYGKELLSLNDRINLKIYENYFFASNEIKCQPQVVVTARSIKTNLIYTSVNRSDFLKDLMGIFGHSLELDGQLDECKYIQCKFCLKLFKELAEFKYHLVQLHTFSDKLAKCVACPYCRQLVKCIRNVNVIQVLNKHILEECVEVRMGTMPVINFFSENGNLEKNSQVEQEEKGEEKEKGVLLDEFLEENMKGEEMDN